MTIKFLESQVINQIAAGEVIERPSSVLKELLENSFDALADQILIEAENGGTTFLKIQDNGIGIDKEDLPFALQQHATSKIEKFNDLDNLATLGFRGEALASIASVAKLKLISRVQQAEFAYQISCDGNPENYNIVPVAHPFGTTLEIRDLFFNVPVRQKFLKKPASEYSHLNDWLGRLILSRNEISFTFKHNQKNIWQFPLAVDDQAQLYRASKILDEQFATDTRRVEGRLGDYKVYGWISNPSYHKNQSDFQYVYLNRRWIRDKNILHAIRLAYQDLIPMRAYPLVLLFLELDPSQFDVNVHPTKTEVRFREPKQIHDLICGAIKKSLAERYSVYFEKKDNFKKDSDKEKERVLGKEEILDTLVLKETEEQKPLLPKAHFLEVNEHNQKDKVNTLGLIKLTPLSLELDVEVVEEKAELLDLEKLSKEVFTSSLVSETKKEGALLSLGRPLAQIQQTFLIAENDKGLVIIDIHAACERITYEKLKKEWAEHKHLGSQRLILPLEITIKDFSLLEDFHSLLQKLGFEWRVYGENKIILLGVPAILNSKGEEVFIDLLDNLKNFSVPEVINQKIDHLLATMACHNSVRSGQNLTLKELENLLRQIENIPNTDRCSHGRPTWVFLTKRELDKLFLRT